MFITKVVLDNWRNFKHAEANLRDTSYIIGVNASGKSNFLDVFRFLRDITKPAGGGLQKAVEDRGGLKKLRCLHARAHPEIRIVIDVSESAAESSLLWRYELEISYEGKGAQRPIVKREVVTAFTAGAAEILLQRPDSIDASDTERLTATAIEQVQSNKNFRTLAEFFSGVTYLHVVPQLIKFGDLIGGRTIENDPFGQGFMERLAKTPERTRESRLRRIEKALKGIVKNLNELSFTIDETGRPHLQIKYEHHRPGGARQLEDQFSDGTLRLIALFWLLLDGDTLLLLEEPELSLNEDIVRSLPLLISQMQSTRKKAKRQIIVATHSSAMLENPGIDGHSLLILDPTLEGTTIRGPSEPEIIAMEAGFSAAETVLSNSQRINGNRLQLRLDL